MEKVDNYLVTETAGKGVIPLSFRPETVEGLPGSFMVEKLNGGSTIITRSDDDDLPFKAYRFIREGHIPATFYGSRDKGYLVNDPPEPGVTVDDLDDHSRAYVRGELPAA